MTKDMTQGSPMKLILGFSVPLLFGFLFQQFYSLVDTVIVGRFLGTDSLAAVGATGSVNFLIIGFCMGVCSGFSIPVAHKFGARDFEDLRRYVANCVWLSLGFAAVLTLLTASLARQILVWMRTPADIIDRSHDYIWVIFLGIPVTFLYNMTSGVIRALGDSRTPVIFLVMSSFLNVGLDLFFIVNLHMGVQGAAWATVISQGVSALLCLRRLVRTEEVYRVDLRRVRIDWPMLKLIVRFGLPSGVQNSLIGFANVMVQTNINAFGDSAMAGCGSYSKIEGFAFLPVTCFSMGLATFVSQNLGARQHDRVKQGARFGVLCSVVTAEVIGVAIWLGAPFFIALFNNDPEVVAFGVRQARVESLFYCLLALNHCIAGVLRGAGKATVPMVIMMVCWCVIRVVYITAAVGIWRNILVIFTAYPLTWSLSAVAFLIYYFKADWLHTFDRLDARQQG